MGYWLVAVDEAGSSEIMILVYKLYSQEAKDFVSENHEMVQAVFRVHEAVKGRRICVSDRGGDRGF